MLIKNFQFLSSLRRFKRDLVSVHGNWQLIFLLILYRVPFLSVFVRVRQWKLFVAKTRCGRIIFAKSEQNKRLEIERKNKCIFYDFSSYIRQKFKDVKYPEERSQLKADFFREFDDAVYIIFVYVKCPQFISNFPSWAQKIFCDLPSLHFSFMRYKNLLRFFLFLFSATKHGLEMSSQRSR